MPRAIFPPAHIVHLLFKAVWQEGRSPGGGALLRLYLLIALEQAGEAWQGWHMVPSSENFNQGRRGNVLLSVPTRNAPSLSFFMSWAENLVDILCHQTFNNQSLFFCVPFVPCAHVCFFRDSLYV